ncbi:hypothetical protein BX600DRAFT_165697, partial [Xylariales sp. PMI_506]
KRDRALELLEDAGTSSSLSPSPLFNSRLALRFSSTHDILLDTCSYGESAISTTEYSQKTSNPLVVFPVYRVAALLLESHEANVDHVCHILHIPTVRSRMKNIYLQTDQNKSIPPNEAALLLSVFALGVFYYCPSANSDIAKTDAEALQLSRIWSRNALDVLNYSHRNGSCSLEDVQACILMAYMTYHLEGFSPRRRVLSTTALSLARELRLHRLDAFHGSLNDTQQTPRSSLDLEVKRRVFWFIASTDWLQSTSSGPQEGTYLIHPNHIEVRIPRDCNDEDILLNEICEDSSGSGSQLTSMTFFLTKLRLAQLCREMTDAVPLNTTKLMKLPYDRIIALDRALEDFISSLPFVFRNDAESRSKSKTLETVYPHIPIMRYCITTAVHSRLCRLHQKFLLRQSLDPSYSYSRLACLESSRTIIQMFEDALGESCATSMATARMAMAVHFTHLALVILVMDLCFNRDVIDADARRLEVKTALEMLECSKDASPLIVRSLSSVYEILERHKIRLFEQESSIASMEPPSSLRSRAERPSLIQNIPMEPSERSIDTGTPYPTLDTSFDEFWDLVAHTEPDFDADDWDALFSALNARPF